MFDASYFDGLSSKPISVIISLVESGLSLSDGEREILWERSLISIETLSSQRQLLLTYGEWPQQRLSIKEEGIDEVRRHLQSGLITQSYQKVSKIKPVPLVLLSMLLIIGISYLYIYQISPAVAEKAVVLIPKKFDEVIGSRNITSSVMFSDIDSTKTDLLNAFYHECGFQSEFNIRLHYCPDRIVNAFAVPGGSIFIYEGLIKKMDSWEELAALISHELAHVNQRHSMKQIARSVSSYIIISVLTGDVAGVSSVILENAQALHQMANSRIMESEADEYGLIYLRAQNINPQGILDLFNTLLDESRGMEDDLSQMSFLLSHPLTSERITTISKQIEQHPTPAEYKESPKLEALWNQIRGSDSEICDDITPQDIIEELKEELKEVFREQD